VVGVILILYGTPQKIVQRGQIAAAMRPVDIAVSADYAFSRLVIIMISREQIYYWNFCHSICVFGLDMEGIGGSEAIDGLKS